MSETQEPANDCNLMQWVECTGCGEVLVDDEDCEKCKPFMKYKENKMSEDRTINKPDPLEIMRFKENGDIYYKGKLLTSDKEIVNALRSLYLTSITSVGDEKVIVEKSFLKEIRERFLMENIFKKTQVPGIKIQSEDRFIRTLTDLIGDEED